MAIPLPTSYPATTTGGDTASPPLLVAIGGPITLACDNNEGRYRIPPSSCRSWRPHHPCLRQQRGEIPHPTPRVSHLEGDLRQFRGGSFYTPLFLSQEAAPSPWFATTTGGDTASPPQGVAPGGRLGGRLATLYSPRTVRGRRNSRAQLIRKQRTEAESSSTRTFLIPPPPPRSTPSLPG